MTFIASNVKLKLMEHYDDEQEVCIVVGAGIKRLRKQNLCKII